MQVRVTAYPLPSAAEGYDRLMELVGDARLVLLGAATHGTHDFYRERGEITKRLIRESGFVALGIEADWADAHRVDRYVRHLGDDRDAADALGDFRRFPTWMWRNTDMVEFVDGGRAPVSGQGRSAGGAARPHPLRLLRRLR